MTAPHDPWFGQHPQRYLDHYAATDFESVPREELHPWFEPRKGDFRASLADPRGALAGYCASLSAVDEQLGRLRDVLAETGHEENTYVIFMSDNGYSCGHHGIWGKGNGTDPLNLWHNSVCVPCVIAGPTVPRAHRIEAPWSTAGLHATICDLAGVALAEDPQVVGVSLRNALCGDESSLASTPVAVHSEYGGARLLRFADYTYIQRFNGPDELYNAVEDREERHNLVSDPAYAKLVGELRAQLQDFFDRAEDAERTAFPRRVAGHGQIHPLWRRYDDDYTYMQS